jgi:Putative Actinobacterial Holin-X, holin superfamily III
MSIVHPIFSVLVSRPELVMDHVAGYAALAQEEASSVGTEVVKRAAAWAICGVGALLFVLFAGIAIMLGAVHEFHWALLVVPAVPLVLAGAAFMVARKRMPGRAFAELRAQLDADAQALRTLGGRP